MNATFHTRHPPQLAVEEPWAGPEMDRGARGGADAGQGALADGGLAEGGKMEQCRCLQHHKSPCVAPTQHPSTSQAEEPTAFIWQPKSLHNQGRESENTRDVRVKRRAYLRGGAVSAGAPQVKHSTATAHVPI